MSGNEYFVLNMFFHDATLEDVFRAPDASGADSMSSGLKPDSGLKGFTWIPLRGL